MVSVYPPKTSLTNAARLVDGRIPFGRIMPLDVGRILRSAVAITALMVLNLGGNAGAAIFFLILVGMVARDSASAYKALAICYLGLMINQYFVPKSLVWTPSRIALPMIALVRFANDLSHLRASLISRSPFIALMFFIVTMAFCSIMSGWYTLIALLKLFNFWTCVTAIFAGALVLRKRGSDLSEWFVALMLSASLFGIAAVVLGQSSNFLRARTGEAMITTDQFNGAFLHPNCHSLYSSMFVLFLACIFILAPYRHRTLVLPIIGLWVGFAVMSKSRTSILAIVLPMALLFVYAAPRVSRLGRTIRANVARSTLVGVSAVLILMAVAYDTATDRMFTKAIVSFFNKAGASESMELDREQILSSRMQLIESSWSNFLEQPVHGIGFQVAKTDFFIKNATLFSAPAEKGFLPTAILEEGGILGTATFVVFILVLTGTWIRERNVPALVLFCGFLVTNFGEVTVFSPGGSGAFGWIMVGAASILGENCWRRPAALPSPGVGVRRQMHEPVVAT